MINIGIAGATGYTGAELIKLILLHPKANLVCVTSKTYEGQSVTEVFPSIRQKTDLICEKLDVDKVSKKIDLVFLALPHKISMHYAEQFIENNVKVIDLSADFRFNNIDTYEKTYQEHTSKHLFEQSVYGLCEIYRNDIKNSSLIGNPGCYPTSILLPLIPLIKEGLINSEGIISDSKSGVSGAGRSVSLGTHFCEVNEGFKPYKVGNHRHTPEIEEILSIHAKKNVRITFLPHLLPLTRGMSSSIYASVSNGITRKDIQEVYNSYYANEPFVRVLNENTYPDIAHVRGTNCCDIGFFLDNTRKQVIIVCVIDNLLKGAAGQAVQNMNIMFGYKDELGLELIQGAL